MSQLATLLDWAESHIALLSWLGVGSLLFFIASIAMLPWLAAQIPADYFTAGRRPAPRTARRWLWRLLRNLFGLLLLASGLAMLVLPGQGLLTILVALILLDYPAKKRLERRLVATESVLKSLNWLRRRRGVAPLQVD